MFRPWDPADVDMTAKGRPWGRGLGDRAATATDGSRPGDAAVLRRRLPRGGERAAPRLGRRAHGEHRRELGRAGLWPRPAVRTVGSLAGSFLARARAARLRAAGGGPAGGARST